MCFSQGCTLVTAEWAPSSPAVSSVCPGGVVPFFQGAPPLRGRTPALDTPNWRLRCTLEAPDAG
eukprot:10663628-Alexandrium_andersonii.AAC.1